jgi:hypothetical protein
MTCRTNNKCICVKDCYAGLDTLFTKGKEYHYSSFYEDPFDIIVSGCERCEAEPELAALGFSHETFAYYFIKYETYLRKQKLKKLNEM